MERVVSGRIAKPRPGAADAAAVFVRPIISVRPSADYVSRLACALLLAWLARGAAADVVYGAVSCPDGPAGAELSVRDDQGQEVGRLQVGADGGYEDYLPPGRYRLVLQRADGVWHGELNSYPHPVRQNLCLRKSE